jgi:hypothetical protein
MRNRIVIVVLILVVLGGVGFIVGLDVATARVVNGLIIFPNSKLSTLYDPHISSFQLYARALKLRFWNGNNMHSALPETIHAKDDNLVTYGDVMRLDRRLVENGWFIDFYENSSQYFIRRGSEECKVPDYAYLDSLGVPREMDILPMEGAKSVIVRRSTSEGKTQIWWHEPKAWHDDYGSPERNGSYVIDNRGRVVQAELNGKVLSYAYDAPKKRVDATSCYKLRLP